MNRDNERRAKLYGLLEREGFSSYMNDTKWMRLIEEVRALNLPMRYRIKVLGDSDISEWGVWFAKEPHPYIELEGSGPIRAIEVEWLEIDATGPWLAGRKDWTPEDPVEYSLEVSTLLEKLAIPYSKDGTLFRIIGHLKRGEIQN